ncbi:uncharacterized protein [Aegilops tauschii subsp. strangulata]|uniref:uncharacterized protein n=1 Tax=Aegilops tauschii subsp. strangulata TaxID=200361 RepID=UPI003CC8A141
METTRDETAKSLWTKRQDACMRPGCCTGAAVCWFRLWQPLGWGQIVRSLTGKKLAHTPLDIYRKGNQAPGPRGGGGALFAVPRLFIGLAAAKRAPDGAGESERSPTSPLDPKALLLRSPRSPRTWDAEPVGLGLVVDVALAAGADSAAAKTCVLSPRLRLRTHGCAGSTTKGCGGGGHSQPELGGKTISCPASATAGMSVPCSRFFHGDLKSGPEAARPDGAHSGAKRHCFHLGELPGPGSLPASIAGGARRFVGSVRTGRQGQCAAIVHTGGLIAFSVNI